MKAILALGNPGDRYRDTRHNAAWWLADRLARAWSLPTFRTVGRVARTGGPVRGEAVELVKPLTYVNRSGDAVRPLLEQPGFEAARDLLVVVDDVWLPPGRVRLRPRGSPGGHKGLASVRDTLGTDAYARLRIGVGSPHDERIDMAEWVLAPLSDAEEEEVLAGFERAIGAVEAWISEGAEAAMNRFN